jgi:hypothetical protein
LRGYGNAGQWDVAALDRAVEFTACDRWVR